jgi:hypothetical protein
MDSTLRNELLDACQANGRTVNDVAQALVDCLMITLIASAPDIESCERSVIAVGSDMQSNIRRAYQEYHGMR